MKIWQGICHCTSLPQTAYAKPFKALYFKMISFWTKLTHQWRFIYLIIFIVVVIPSLLCSEIMFKALNFWYVWGISREHNWLFVSFLDFAEKVNALIFSDITWSCCEILFTKELDEFVCSIILFVAISCKFWAHWIVTSCNFIASSCNLTWILEGMKEWI